MTLAELAKPLIQISIESGSWDSEQEAALEYLQEILPKLFFWKILVVGASGDIFSELLSSLGYEVWSVDYRPYSLVQSDDPEKQRSRPISNFRFMQGDFNLVELPKDYFDLALAVSSIEHFGLGRWKDPIDPDGDLKAVKKVKECLKFNGLFLNSIPHGAFDKIESGNQHRYYSENGRLKILMEGFEELKRSKSGDYMIIYLARKL